ncbi:MAG: nitroreductase family protein, partial [Lachnospiraceae bacterium]|nr:nitroreductase family protein [Lachnospiraceae bacterium]
MEFEEILRKRHSVRKFDNRQIREDMLWDIIDDARKSPSWANAQERGVYIASKEKA